MASVLPRCCHLRRPPRRHAANSHPTLPTALGWQTHVTMTLFTCSNFMTPDNFYTFLTQGLAPAQQLLDSPLWLSSPFQPWTRLATRPCCMTRSALTTLPTSRKDLTPASASTPSGTPIFHASSPTLRAEWLPASQRAFQRWQRMMGQRLVYERQARAEREHGHIVQQPLISPAPVSDASSSSTQQPMSEVDDVLAGGFSVMGIAT
jgi:hypothetical protein